MSRAKHQYPGAWHLYGTFKEAGAVPSCAARRAAATAALLREEVLEEVGHAQWVLVMPKMLRPYFLCRIRHRKYYADSGTMPR